jgi:hypothetical protein
VLIRLYHFIPIFLGDCLDELEQLVAGCTQRVAASDSTCMITR